MMPSLARHGAPTVAAFACLVLASPVWAASIVRVLEEGEGGDKMSLKLDTATVKAGPVTFDVKNDAATEEHEMVLVRLKSTDQKIPFDAAKHRVDERKLKSLGEVADLKPGMSGQLTVTLASRTYMCSAI